MTAEIVLYDYVLAYFPARVRLTLNELGIHYKHVHVDIFGGKNLTIDFAKINPSMTLPVLVEGDKILNQSAEICEYLISKNDSPINREWFDLLKDWDGNAFSAMNSPETVVKIMAQWRDFKLKTLEKRKEEIKGDFRLSEAFDAKIKIVQRGFDRKEFAKCREQLDLILTKAEADLEQNEFLGGSDYSLSDILLTSLLVRICDAGQFQVEMERKPHIKEYFQRVQERDSFKKTFKDFVIQKHKVLAVLPNLLKWQFSSLTGRY